MSNLNDQIYNAFKEFMVTRMRIPKAAVPAYWDIFWKSLEWRIWPKKYISPDGYSNCLFVKIPRTATSSINSILKQTGGHKTALEWKRRFTPEMWNRLFKFTIVRDPYTRFVSAYYLAGFEYGTLNKKLKEGGMSSIFKKNEVAFLPQYDFVYSGHLCLVDYIGKFENLEEDWKHIASQIGCDPKLPREGKSFSKKERLTKTSKDIIYRHYKKDFDFFDYKK